MPIEQAFNDSIAYYDDWMRKALPNYDDLFGTARDLIPFDRGAVLDVLDLGAGTGLFSQHVLERYPQARFVLYDLAEKMLAVARDMLRGNRWLYEQVTRNCRDFVVADTLPALVEKMNALVGDGSVDLGAVSDAATIYDSRIDAGPRFHDDEQLRRIEFARRWIGDRLRTCKFQKILDPKAGPLVAIREFIISRKSMGGLVTDLDCRVLDGSGEPIPGLYAAGESAGFGGGGMNGKRGLEGTFLGGCLFGGRIAGRTA